MRYSSSSYIVMDSSRRDIEAAMEKAVELRALHASLFQGKSAASPLSRHATYFSAQDYPVFTPSYEDDEALGAAYAPENPQNWKDYNLDAGNQYETIPSDYTTSSRKGYTRGAADQTSAVASSSHNAPLSKSRRTSLGDIESVSSCNDATRSSRKSNLVVPLTDSHSSLHPHAKPRLPISLSWLFPRLKSKSSVDSGESTLRRALAEAQQRRDAALAEAAEMRKSLGELAQKLEYLEAYCEETNKALRQKASLPPAPASTESLMPVSGDVMAEGFLQMAAEARLSVRQFCKTLVAQIGETDHALLDHLNSLLRPYKLSLSSRCSRAAVYHLEGVVNRSLHRDFENCVFRESGAAKLPDRRRECQARFQLFVALRNLRWDQVLRKGTKYYSDEFSKFCDERMSGIIGVLGWTRPWPEQLLQAFFVAAKCVWLLHLLAFSFDPAVGILRVEESKAFEGRFMEDVMGGRQRGQGGPSRVKMMVMPGFYMHHQVLKCKVLCTYKPLV